VAPIPGETKIWQYITLFRNIYLIDCPGVVVDTAGDTETDSVLKGVVRSERLECPEDYTDAILAAVKREHIAAMYGLQKSGGDTWTTAEELLEKIAVKSGRLLKGGEPCLRTAAIMIINDFQRGRLPHFVAPPELKEDEKDGIKRTGARTETTAEIEGVMLDPQNLDNVQCGGDEEEEERVADKVGAQINDDGLKGEMNIVENKGMNELPCGDSDANEHSTPLAVVGAGDWD